MRVADRRRRVRDHLVTDQQHGLRPVERPVLGDALPRVIVDERRLDPVLLLEQDLHQDDRRVAVGVAVDLADLLERPRRIEPHRQRGAVAAEQPDGNDDQRRVGPLIIDRRAEGEIDLVADELVQQQAGDGEPQIQIREVPQPVNERQRVDEADDAETNRSLRDGR
jgi:hypothetical protein